MIEKTPVDLEQDVHQMIDDAIQKLRLEIENRDKVWIERVKSLREGLMELQEYIQDQNIHQK